MLKSVHQLVLKMRINEQNLGLHVINVYIFFETLRKTYVYENSNQLSIRLFPQGSNVMPVEYNMFCLYYLEYNMLQTYPQE